MSPEQCAQISALLGFKTFDQLSEKEQQRALKRALKKEVDSILSFICKYGPECFDDELTAKLNAAWDKAEEMLTPWFVGEYIMDTCKKEIEEMAKDAVAEIIYKTEPDQEIPVFVDISK